MDLKTAMKCAQERSAQYRCGVFVYAQPRLVTIDGEDKAVIPHDGYGITDWHDPSVIATFIMGKRKES